MLYKTNELPKEYKKAFKDADIRGVYPNEIDETVAYRVARAFVEEYGWGEVLVARDMRTSSPTIHEAFIDGLRDSGAVAIDIGIVDTPGLYFASGSYDLPGVVITASHNPAEYNGLKLVEPGAIPLTKERGLLAIMERVEENTFSTSNDRGGLESKSITQEYVSYIQERATLKADRPLKVVVDAGNGTAGPLMEELCDSLPVDITPLFFDLDGTFPNRASNPTLAKNQKAIKEKLKEGDYDLGVAFDGDSDRVAFFDEDGNYINSSFIGALISKHLLKQYPKSSHVYTVFTSRAYEDTIKEFGGNAVIARVGHAFIKEVMREKDAVFGCEHSGHFYFKDNYYTDSGILTFLFVAAAFLEQVNEEKHFSKLLQPFAKYFQTEEVSVSVKDKEHALEEIVSLYKEKEPESIEQFDGVSVRFPEYWFTIKKSVTEDVLKFVVESRDERVAMDRQEEIIKQLSSY